MTFRVFISTDDITLVQAIQRDFPAYHVLYNETAIRLFKTTCSLEQPALSALSALHQEGLFQLLTLASADFFVGSLSSSMARTVYQLRMAGSPSAWTATFRYV